MAALPMSLAATLNVEFDAGFVGREPSEIDLVIDVDRRLQRRAISSHGSQANDNPVLWKRLALRADTECLRWLRTARRAECSRSARQASFMNIFCTSLRA